MKKIIFGGLFFCSLAMATSTSALFQDYMAREKTKINAQQNAVVEFLKAIPYNVQGVIEIEILTPQSTFLIRDRNGDICFGDTEHLTLRCKNEMGLLGVTFSGADGD